MTEYTFTPVAGLRNHQFSDVDDICALRSEFDTEVEERRAVAMNDVQGWL